MGHKVHPALLRPAAGRMGKSPSPSRASPFPTMSSPRQQAAHWDGPQARPDETKRRVSPVPVSTFTFCIFPSLTATRFSTLTTSSQAPSRP